MNMPISSTPMKTATAATSGGVNSSSKSAGISGFAGVLIQVIDGVTQPSPSVEALTMPVGLVSILGALGLDSNEVPSDELLAMIAKIVEQLEQLEPLENSQALPQETLEQLTTILVAFQGLLQQLDLNKTSEIFVQSLPSDNTDVTAQVIIPLMNKPVVKQLRETLQELSTVLTMGLEKVKEAAVFVNKLKTMLDQFSAGPQVMTNVQADSNQVEQAAIVSKKTEASALVTQVTKDATNQAAAVVVETSRPVQVIRDPIWRMNLVENVDQTATEGQPAIVSATTGAEVVNDSDSQPAWTLLRNDAASATEATAGKPQLPAQVPVQQFAQQIEKFLVKQFLMTQGNGTTEAKITLNPEHLGQVDIRIIMQNGIVTAQFMTENGMARDLLDNQLSQLRTALQGQGLQVDRLEVVQQSAESSNTSFMQKEQRHPGNNGNGSNGRGKNGSYEDPAVFAAELERSSSLKEFGYGSSLNVIA